ncbi:hypothetical protein [Streptomyces californicus]|uniref:hypothetical protein n=1 Tax=Streptomyces californicus TaxID=67351 RepID=UPI0037A3D39B
MTDQTPPRRAPAARPQPRKQTLLRLDPAVHDALARWASDELRSTNAQIEFLLRRALAEAGRLPGSVRPIARRGRPPGRPPEGPEPSEPEESAPPHAPPEAGEAPGSPPRETHEPPETPEAGEAAPPHEPPETPGGPPGAGDRHSP